ncbi:MAG: tetratricopeptide repeat protein [Candidatus Krumholzibacteriia bacterium]
MPTHKLTRKELKHDSFMEGTARATDFLQANYARVGIGLLIVIALIFGVRFMQQGQARAAQKASFLLFQGESLLQRGAFAEAKKPLQELRDSFGGSKFAPQAGFDLAQAQTALGENDAALATLDKILAGNSGDASLKAALQMLKGSVLGSLKRYPEAQTTVRGLLQTPGLDARDRYDATLLLADLLRLDGKPGEAADALTALKKDIDSGTLDIEARDLDSRIQLLKALAG